MKIPHKLAIVAVCCHFLLPFSAQAQVPPEKWQAMKGKKLALLLHDGTLVEGLLVGQSNTKVVIIKSDRTVVIIEKSKVKHLKSKPPATRQKAKPNSQDDGDSLDKDSQNNLQENQNETPERKLYQKKRRHKQGLIKTGLILFGTGYLLQVGSLALACSASECGRGSAPGFPYSFIPIVGGSFSLIGASFSYSSNFFLNFGALSYTVSLGLTQVTGIVMTLTGLAYKLPPDPTTLSHKQNNTLPIAAHSTTQKLEHIWTVR